MASLLIVDNDAGMIQFLRTTLGAAGHSVESAANGLTALTRLDQSKRAFDLMLVDIVMPGLNGFNLALMALVRQPDLKIIYLAESAELPLVAKYEGSSLGRLLEKPIAAPRLISEVTKALSGG
jgi:two-component system cell cycle response regulator CpdR